MNVKPLNSGGTTAARATRLLRLLAVCLIPALGGLAALPAAAQTTETFVSNIGQAANNQGVSVDWFTQFTTGSNTGGYKLTAVDMVLPDGATMTATFEVKVFTTTSNNPDSSLGTLTAPATLSSGTNTFTAPGAGIDLDANTTYGVFFDVTGDGTGSVGATNGNAEDSGAAAGWSIADTSRHRIWSSTGANWSTDNGSMRFAIKGQAKTATSPTITIAAGTSPVTEGTAAQFTVTANPAPSANLKVNLTVADATGSDFVASGDEGSKTVTIAANATTATHSVPTTADTTDEPNGDVSVTVGIGTGYTVGSTSSASVRVDDNDGPSVSSVAVVSKPRTDANSDGTPETYGAGQNITVAVTWSKAVTWDLSAATNAGIGVRLNIGGTQRRAELVTGGATSGAATTLWFSYTVVSGDTDTDGVAVTTATGNRLVLLRNGATLKDADGDNAEVTHAGLTAQSGHLVNGGNSAPGNSAPVFNSDDDPDTDDRNLGVANAPTATLVHEEMLHSWFSDPDGDTLHFTLSAVRNDVYWPTGLRACS